MEQIKIIYTYIDVNNNEISKNIVVRSNRLISKIQKINKKNTLKSISLEGIAPSDCSELFLNVKSSNIDLSKFDTSKTTNMSNMFCQCLNLTSLDISNWNTSSVKNMNCMFFNCNGLTNLDVSGFDTNNVTDISGMFSHCSSLTSLDVSGFDTSNVTSMNGVFNGCSNLTSLDVSNFDTSNVIYMSSMFNNCSGLTTLDVSSFDTSNVKEMSYMFGGCVNLTTLDVSGFDTSNVTSINSMFYGRDNLNDLEINWDISNIKNMMKAFKVKEKKESNFKNKLKIKLKNGKKIKDLHQFLYENKNIDYLEINLTNINNMTDFINEENELKYLKLTGVEEYIQNHINLIEEHPQRFRDKTRKLKLKEILKRGVQIEKDFCDIFFDDKTKRETIENYKRKLPHIEIVNSTKSISYDIIIDNNGKQRLKEKIKIIEKNIENKRKIEKIKIQKDTQIIEMNL